MLFAQEFRSVSFSLERFSNGQFRSMARVLAGRPALFGFLAFARRRQSGFLCRPLEMISYKNCISEHMLCNSKQSFNVNYFSKSPSVLTCVYLILYTGVYKVFMYSCMSMYKCALCLYAASCMRQSICLCVYVRVCMYVCEHMCEYTHVFACICIYTI